MEHSIEQKQIYRGAFIELFRDKVQLDNGFEAVRDVVRHPGGVVILPVDKEGVVTLVQQYRYPVGKTLLELPAGKLEPGEDPELAACRELQEETGLRAGSLEKLGCIYTSPGISDEALWLYYATELTQGEMHPDPDESIALEMIPFLQLVNMIGDGFIRDAKTIASVSAAYFRYYR